MQLTRAELIHSWRLEGLGHERADACGDEDGTGVEHCACRGADLPASVVEGLQSLYLLGQMAVHLHGRDLLLQQLHQLQARADRNAGDVVDGLVCVELAALAAHMGQGIDQMGLNALQAKLKGLKQTRRTCANDDGVGFHGGL